MERKAVYLHLEDESFAKTNRTDENEIDAVQRRRRRRAKSPLARVRLSSRSSRLRIIASRPFAGWDGQWRHAEPRREVRRRASLGIPRARRRLHLRPRGDARVCVWPDVSVTFRRSPRGWIGGRAPRRTARGHPHGGHPRAVRVHPRCSRDPRPRRRRLPRRGAICPRRPIRDARASDFESGRGRFPAAEAMFATTFPLARVCVAPRPRS